MPCPPQWPVPKNGAGSRPATLSSPIEYKKNSIEAVPPSARKATTRFVSMTGKNLPGVDVYSITSEVEYNCRQPLQKILSARIVEEERCRIVIPPSAIGEDPSIIREADFLFK